jgi:hypothetical protein
MPAMRDLTRMYDENVRKLSWVSFWRVIRALQSNIIICYFHQPAPPYLTLSPPALGPIDPRVFKGILLKAKKS